MKLHKTLLVTAAKLKARKASPKLVRSLRRVAKSAVPFPQRGLSDEERNKPFWEKINSELEGQLRYFGPTHGELSVISDTGSVYNIFLEVLGEKDDQKLVRATIYLEDSKQDRFWAKDEADIASRMQRQLQSFAASGPTFRSTDDT
jgi:hypothetical protein